MDRDSLPLKSSVGAGAANYQEDIIIVQASLSILKPSGGEPAYYSGRVDQYAGPKTVEAIKAFQLA